MTSTIKIGRREFLTDKFIEAVQNSKNYSETCEKLGMNKTVQTTLNNIKKAITDLNIDISHFTYKYTISEKVGKSNAKGYTLSKDNHIYYNEFLNSFKIKSSMQQYKVDCGAFLEQLIRQDFTSITAEDIKCYSEKLGGSEKTKHNREAHIRSMMIYLVKNNINGALEKVSKEMLVYLISR